jgi:predicted branched-subunit amino acid permease
MSDAGSPGEELPAYGSYGGSAFGEAPMDVGASRRRLVLDSLGVIAAVCGFAVVFGLSARAAGFSAVEAMAMSTILFAGSAQFAAAGSVAAGLGWPAIALQVGSINARHLLYSTTLAPYLEDQPRWLRALMAHVLTDEAFALSIAHFRRIGRADLPGYWWASLGVVFVPWNVFTLVGVALGGAIVEPRALGLDVVFPVAMAGLGLGLIHGRREIVAGVAGAAVAVGVGLSTGAFGGVIVGGLVGPLVAILAERGRLGGPVAGAAPGGAA